MNFSYDQRHSAGVSTFQHQNFWLGFTFPSRQRERGYIREDVELFILQRGVVIILCINRRRSLVVTFWNMWGGEEECVHH